MTQNFFLIHDDIMDNSDLRRGKPTVHKVYEKKHGRHYGESMAITLGDVAAIEVFKIIGESGFSDKQKVICLEQFSKVLLETGYGQALDLEYSYEKAGISQIYKIADLKAARYSVVGPLLIGAGLAGVGEIQKKAILNFGLNAGLAFQLQDDFLGLFGREETIGKSVLSDMREGKNTVLIYKTRGLAPASDRSKIDKIWGNKNASGGDLDIIRNIVRNSGALEWCKRENSRLIKKAKSEIAKITQDVNLQTIFGQIADFIVSREK
jgi:geranylgeranyl diphosphate synthase type I